MRKFLFLLMVSVFVFSCEEDEVDSSLSPSLAVEFGQFVEQDLVTTVELFSVQDSVYFQNLEQSIVVSIQENFLQNPELIGGNEMRNDEFIYTFVVETSAGDREIFVSNDNISLAGGGSGDSQLDGIWYSEMINDFVVPINYSDEITAGNNFLDLDKEQSVEMTVTYVSQFSDLSINESIKIVE